MQSKKFKEPYLSQRSLAHKSLSNGSLYQRSIAHKSFSKEVSPKEASIKGASSKEASQRSLSQRSFLKRSLFAKNQLTKKLSQHSLYKIKKFYWKVTQFSFMAGSKTQSNSKMILATVILLFLYLCSSQNFVFFHEYVIIYILCLALIYFGYSTDFKIWTTTKKLYLHFINSFFCFHIKIKNKTQVE